MTSPKTSPAKNDSIPKKFLMMNENGFSRIEITVSEIGNADKILQECATRLTTTIPRVGSLKGMPVTLNCSRESIVVASQFPALKLHTHYRVIEDNAMAGATMAAVPSANSTFICPAFTRDRKYVQMALEWTPPKGMQLWFLTVVPAYTNEAASALRPTATYLIARDAESKRTYLPPLPNLYDDGKICMGHSFEETHPDLMALHAACLEFFFNSNFNTDLDKDWKQSGCRELFRFDVDGKQLPFTGDWIKSCKPCANSNYDFLGKI